MVKAEDIMTREVVTIEAIALVSEAIGLMKKHHVHSLIVEPDGQEKGYGIVTEADIAYKVIAEGNDPKALTVGDIMTKPCITIRPDLSVQNVSRLFLDNHIHRAPVIQEQLLGIVSVSDILQKGIWWQE
jgi:CBS domain-containing protein